MEIQHKLNAEQTKQELQNIATKLKPATPHEVPFILKVLPFVAIIANGVSSYNEFNSMQNLQKSINQLSKSITRLLESVQDF